MSGDWLIAAAMIGGAALAIAWRSSRRRSRIERRLAESRDEPLLESDAVAARRAGARETAVAVAAGVALMIALRWRLGVEPPLAVALGCVAGIIAHILLGLFALRGLLRMEQQLADAVDMLAASLSAGLSSLAAIDVAAQQSRPPLHDALAAMSGRLRLGEDPGEVFRHFHHEVPLQSARLLAFTLGVHWEVGGSIAPALRNVARVVRDRIDLNRRIRSQAAEAQLSVIGILLITYAVAGLMWTSNPEGAREFFSSRTGAQLAALIVALQAIGLLWMRRLARVTP